MRLLVSPMNIEEARAALSGGADILDVKNPKEGSLGANFPWAIKAVAELAGGRVPVSATIGDLDYKPGTASLAALGAAFSGADYVKAGLLGVRSAEQAGEMLENIVRAVKGYDRGRRWWHRPIPITVELGPSRQCFSRQLQRAQAPML